MTVCRRKSFFFDEQVDILIFLKYNSSSNFANKLISVSNGPESEQPSYLLFDIGSNQLPCFSDGLYYFIEGLFKIL